MKLPEVEQKLVNWIWDMFNKNIYLSDEIIEIKASSLLNENLSTGPGDHQIQLQLSNRWLHIFKVRNKFKRFYSHGESFNLDLKSVTEKYLQLSKTLQVRYQRRLEY